MLCPKHILSNIYAKVPKMGELDRCNRVQKLVINPLLIVCTKRCPAKSNGSTDILIYTFPCCRPFLRIAQKLLFTHKITFVVF